MIPPDKLTAAARRPAGLSSLAIRAAVRIVATGIPICHNLWLFRSLPGDPTLAQQFENKVVACFRGAPSPRTPTNRPEQRKVILMTHPVVFSC